MPPNVMASSASPPRPVRVQASTVRPSGKTPYVRERKGEDMVHVLVHFQVTPLAAVLSSRAIASKILVRMLKNNPRA